MSGEAGGGSCRGDALGGLESSVRIGISSNGKTKRIFVLFFWREKKISKFSDFFEEKVFISEYLRF